MWVHATLTRELTDEFWSFCECGVPVKSPRMKRVGAGSRLRGNVNLHHHASKLATLALEIGQLLREKTLDLRAGRVRELTGDEKRCNQLSTGG